MNRALLLMQKHLSQKILRIPYNRSFLMNYFKSLQIRSLCWAINEAGWRHGTLFCVDGVGILSFVRNGLSKLNIDSSKVLSDPTVLEDLWVSRTPIGKS